MDERVETGCSDVEDGVAIEPASNRTSKICLQRISAHYSEMVGSGEMNKKLSMATLK